MACARSTCDRSPDRRRRSDPAIHRRLPRVAGPAAPRAGRAASSGPRGDMVASRPARAARRRGPTGAWRLREAQRHRPRATRPMDRGRGSRLGVCRRKHAAGRTHRRSTLSVPAAVHGDHTIPGLCEGRDDSRRFPVPRVRAGETVDEHDRLAATAVGIVNPHTVGIEERRAVLRPRADVGDQEEHDQCEGQHAPGSAGVTNCYEPRCSRRNASVRDHASSVARRLAVSPSWAFRNTVAPS